MRKFLLISVLAVQIICVNAQTNGKLTVTLTTSTAGGDYASKNCLAIWVQNSNNQIQKTLLLNSNNGNSQGIAMSAWFTAIGSNWANRNNYKDLDGITSATNTNYGQKTCYWGNTVNLSAIPDGIYTVKMELLDGHNATLGTSGHYVASYTFNKTNSLNSGVLLGTLANCFNNVSIQWVPSTTALTNIELSTLYSIYPNPAKESFYVNGPDIKSIDLFTLEGKQILSSNQQKINIDAIKKGVYMLSINTGKGIVSKKLMKE